MAVDEFRIGRYTAAQVDGTDKKAVLGRFGDVLTQLYGQYYEVTKSKLLWHAQVTDAGVAPGTDSVSTTQAVSVYNPAGSGFDVVILVARLCYHSGTLGAGEMLWTKNTNPLGAAVSGTAMSVSNGYLGDVTPPGGVLFLQAATVPAAPTLMRVMCSLDATLATTASIGAQVVLDEVGGAIIVPAGMSVNLAADAAAGSTPLVSISISALILPA